MGPAISQDSPSWTVLPQSRDRLSRPCELHSPPLMTQAFAPSRQDETLAGSFQRFQEARAVGVVPEGGPSLIAPRRDVVHRIFEFNSDGSCHAEDSSQGWARCQVSRVDPSPPLSDLSRLNGQRGNLASSSLQDPRPTNHIWGHYLRLGGNANPKWAEEPVRREARQPLKAACSDSTASVFLRR
jgi:hypothetical protein